MRQEGEVVLGRTLILQAQILLSAHLRTPVAIVVVAEVHDHIRSHVNIKTKLITENKITGKH